MFRVVSWRVASEWVSAKGEAQAGTMRPGRTPRGERDSSHLKARMFRDEVDLDSDYMEVSGGAGGAERFLCWPAIPHGGVQK